MRALLIDGNAHSAFAIGHMLAAAGWIVDHADTAAKGLPIARQGRYDLVVSDLSLPDLSGRELVRRIRATNLTRPLLVLSRASEADGCAIAVEAGADAYLQKPVGGRELLTRLGMLLARPAGTEPSYAASGGNLSPRQGGPYADSPRPSAMCAAVPMPLLTGLRHHSPFGTGD